MTQSDSLPSHVARTFALVACALASTVGSASDWPQWRGPNRDGVTAEHSGWPKGWPPKRLWGKNVGRGSTSPILAAGRLYVMGWHGSGNRRRNPVGTDAVRCFDARTGREIWKQTYPCRYQPRTRAGDLGQYGGPNSTPALDAQTKYLYTLSTDGHFRCWDTAQKGRSVWKKDLHAEYKVRRRGNVGGGARDFGFTSSPLILNDLVVIEVGADRGTVIAFDKKTGAERWTSQLKGPGGHTSGPVALTVGGAPCLANLTLRKLVVMRLDKGHEGKTLTEHKWQTHFGCNLATPVVVPGGVILTASYSTKRTARIEIAAKGARQKWSSRTHSLVSTPVADNGRLFMVPGRAACLDLKNGRQLWRGGTFYHGSCLVTGDDKLIAFGKGQLVLLDAKANKYRELGRVNGVCRDVCYPHVALAGGVLCCKDKAGNLVAFGLGR